MDFQQPPSRVLAACTLSFGVLFGLVGTGCQTVTPNPADSSPPKVEIKARINNQYTTVTQIDYTGEALELMCLVTDPQGVKSLRLTFFGTASSCNVNGSIFSGSFPVTPLPAPLEQVLTGNSSGQVLTKLPMFQTLNGPFTCKPLANPTGTPLGSDITVRCRGRNWSSNAAVAEVTTDLKVTITSGS